MKDWTKPTFSSPFSFWYHTVTGPPQIDIDPYHFFMKGTRGTSKEEKDLFKRKLIQTMQQDIDEYIAGRPENAMEMALNLLALSDEIIKQLNNVDVFVSMLIEQLVKIEEYEICHQLKEATK